MSSDVGWVGDFPGWTTGWGGDFEDSEIEYLCSGCVTAVVETWGGRCAACSGGPTL